MRGATHRHVHGTARGRARDAAARGLAGRATAAGVAAVLAFGPVLAGGASPAVAAGEDTFPLKLPTEADAVAVVVGIEGLLHGAGRIETRLPGAVTDRERVGLAFGLDGSLVAATDDQRLALTGVGDFEFKVPGPASDVEALPGSENPPGLRRGAVLWQGFCSGSKRLGARVSLLPGEEARRLPIRVRLEATVGGAPIPARGRVSGPLRLRLEIENVSAVPIQMVDAPMDEAAGARVLDGIRADLLRGARPAPGEGAVPIEVPARQPASFRTEDVEAPMSVRGTISFPAGEATGITATGGEVRTSMDAVEVRFGGLLGGGRPLRLAVEVRGRAIALALPRVEFDMAPAPPAAATVRPPSGRTWTEGLQRNPSAFEWRTMLGLIRDTLWRRAWLLQFDAYLGNPDPTGPASTAYHFVLAPALASRAAPPGGSSNGPLGAAAAAVVAVLVVLGGLVVWSRS